MANNTLKKNVSLNINMEEITMTNNTTKLFALVADADYVSAADRDKKWAAIKTYQKRNNITEEKCDSVSLNRFPTEEQSRTFFKDIITDCKAGVYDRVYLIKNSKFESDWYRENTYPKSEQYAYMTLKERFEAEYHAQDERIQVPEKFGDVDTTLHWFISNIGPNVDVVHIDMSEGNPFAYSVTEEYFAEVSHRPYDQEEADWAIAFGLSREITAELLKILPDEHDRYLYANGGSEPGNTPDAQVVKCPVCGRPTWAAPASVGSKDSYDGTYRPSRVDSKQMTCEHCKADLSPCFND